MRKTIDKADIDLMDQYLDQLDWQVNENSNMTFSLQGLNNYISSEISKVYWLTKNLPDRDKRCLHKWRFPYSRFKYPCGLLCWLGFV